LKNLENRSASGEATGIVQRLAVVFEPPRIRPTKS